MYGPDGRNGWRFLAVKGVDGREGCRFLTGKDFEGEGFGARLRFMTLQDPFQDEGSELLLEFGLIQARIWVLIGSRHDVDSVCGLVDECD